STIRAPVFPSLPGSRTYRSFRVAQPTRAVSARGASQTRFRARAGRESVFRRAGPNKELGPAHAENRRRRLDLHRLGRLLGQLAGNDGQGPLLQRAVEGALVGRRVEHETIDREHAVRTDRDQTVVAERDTDRAIRPRDHHVAWLHDLTDVGGELLYGGLQCPRAFGLLCL